MKLTSLLNYTIIVLVMFFSCQLDICAQEAEEIPPFDCYQIYFDEPVKGVVKVEYTDSKDPLQYRLNEDNTKLILDNYKGKKRIEYTVINNQGEEKKYAKSSCFIDPCEINL